VTGGTPGEGAAPTMGAVTVRLRCDPALEGHLPRPVPAQQALPGWLKAMPMRARSDMHDGDIRTVKQCPPFIDAMRLGFTMLLPCDVHYADGVFSWAWNLPEPSAAGHPRAPINFNAAAQVAGAPFGNDNLVKFVAFWTVELPRGWSLLTTHPLNRDDLPFRTLTGFVDADRFHQVGLLFPARWLDPETPRTLPRGTPIAQCIPLPRTSPALDIGTMDPDAVTAFARTGQDLLSTPGVYRTRFRVRAR